MLRETVEEVRVADTYVENICALCAKGESVVIFIERRVLRRNLSALNMTMGHELCLLLQPMEIKGRDGPTDPPSCKRYYMLMGST